MLRDYHTIGESGEVTLGYGADWSSQTFTPWFSYSITSVSLKLWKSGGTPGTITVSIRATDGSGKPTGADLAYGTINGNDVTGSTPGEWYNFVLDTPLNLAANTRYAIVMRSIAGVIKVRRSGTSDYAFGNEPFSADSGVSWTIPASPNAYDKIFKTYDNTTFTPQVMFVGGAVDGGKHLWKVSDNGTALSVEDSYVMAGEVSNLAYSAITKKLYVAVGNLVYCYDSGTMTLDTAWGSSGLIDIGNTVKDIAVDSLDYLAVAHHVVDTNKRISLYDDTGTLDWRSTVFSTNTQGAAVSFNLGGNINASTNGGSSGTQIATLLSRTDGSLITSYETRVVGGINGKVITSSKDTEAHCFYVSSYSSTALYLKNGAATVWNKSITGTSVSDLLHLPDVDVLIAANSSSPILYYDIVGTSIHPNADYITPTSSFGATITRLDSNDSSEVYYSLSTGYLKVGNPNLSYKYELAVSGGSLNSVVWARDLNIAPTITVQPTDETKTVGDEVTFFITTSGTPDPTYQWKKDGNDISGATDSSYAILSVVVADGAVYTCVVTNVAGSVNSTPATLSVTPYISAQSSDMTICSDAETTLSITASGYPAALTYKWYKDNVEVLGETASTIVIHPTSNTTYKCIVTNDVTGSDTSDDIVLTVIDNPYTWNLFNLTLDSGRTDLP